MPDINELMGMMREWNREALDETEYIFLEPLEINLRRVGPGQAQARDCHIYTVDENNRIRESCCGKFPLNTEHRAVGKLASRDARFRAAEKGREVCGRCVASLYSNTDTHD